MKSSIHGVFKNKLLLSLKDDSLSEFYSEYSSNYFKLFLSMIFSNSLLITNFLMSYYDINIKIPIEEKNSSLIINCVLFILLFFSLISIILTKFIKKFKIYFNKVYHFISFLCLFNIILQIQIFRSNMGEITYTYMKEYFIPYLSSVLALFYIFFVHKNFIAGSLSFLFADLIIICLSIGRDWSEDWVSILCQLFQWICLTYFNYMIEMNDKEWFVLCTTIKSRLDIKKDFIENMNFGVLSINENSIDFNSKTKNMFKLEDDEKENHHKIKNFMLEKYVTLNENLEENLKIILLDLPQNNHDNDESYKSLIKDSLKYMKENESFQEFVYIGDKIYVNTDNDLCNKNYYECHTLRVFMRYNKFSKFIDIFLDDISSIVEVEDLKASDKYRKLFLNKFSHEFKNPLINILQLIRNLKTKMTETTLLRKGSNLHKSSHNYSNFKQSHTGTSEFSGATSNNENLILNANYTCNQNDLKDLTHIRNLSEYMISLIGDFDFISNYDAKTLQSKSKNIIVEGKFDLKKLIKNCIRIFKTKADITDKTTRFLYEVDPGIKTINSDSRRLKQIMLNILSNSFKFTQNGEISINVTKNKEDNNLINFIIIDTGSGIKNHEILYECNKENDVVLLRSKTGGLNNIYGIGLGLKVVKSLISLLGKNFEMESIENKGTIVKFSLFLDLSKKNENSKIDYTYTNNQTEDPLFKYKQDSTQFTSGHNMNSHLDIQVKNFSNNLRTIYTYQSNHNIISKPTLLKKPIKTPLLIRSITDKKGFTTTKFSRLKTEEENAKNRPILEKVNSISKKDYTNGNTIIEENYDKNQSGTIRESNTTVMLNSYNLNINENDKSFGDRSCEINNSFNNLLKDPLKSSGKILNYIFDDEIKIKIKDNSNTESDRILDSHKELSRVSVLNGNFVNTIENLEMNNENNIEIVSGRSSNQNLDLTPPIKILLVDDERLIRQSELRMILKFFASKERPIEIVECTDGVECLYQLFKGIQAGIQYDYIITDETMNFMRGSLMAKTIKSLMTDNVMYNVKIYMVTSYEYSTIIDNFGHVVDGVITKPLSQDNIMKIFSNFEYL